MSERNWPWIAALLVLGALGCGEAAPVDPRTDPNDGPPTGNGDGSCSVPGEAQLEDVSSPDPVIGDGSPASCTAEAFVDAVARGGAIVQMSYIMDLGRLRSRHSTSEGYLQGPANGACGVDAPK